MVGIVSIDKGLALAKHHNCDLVEISPNARPPVCKVVNFNKYKYELRKKRT